MPGFIAVELCKMFGAELTFVRPDFSKYTAASRQVRAVLVRYDPHVAMHSLDEVKVGSRRSSRSVARQELPPVTRRRGHSLDEVGSRQSSNGVARQELPPVT